MCPPFQRYSITSSDRVLWLSMGVFDYDSMKRGIAIVAVLAMLAPLTSVAEIIDYHQHSAQRQAHDRLQGRRASMQITWLHNSMPPESAGPSYCRSHIVSQIQTMRQFLMNTRS